MSQESIPPRDSPGDRHRPDTTSPLITAAARLDALMAATSDVVYRMSADWSEMQPLDGRGLVPSNDAPIRDWMQRNIPLVEHARIHAAISEAIADKTVFELEHRVAGADGGEAWIHSRAVPLLDDRGEIVEWFGVARDITKAKQAEQALRESEQRFRSVFEQSTAGIAQVDVGGRIVLVNDRYCEIVGRPRDALLGLPMQDLTHPDDLARNLELFEQVVTGRIPSFTIEKRYLKPDGSSVWVQNAVSATQGADGEVRYITAVVADISAARAARPPRACSPRNASSPWTPPSLAGGSTTRPPAWCPTTRGMRKSTASTDARRARSTTSDVSCTRRMPRACGLPWRRR